MSRGVSHATGTFAELVSAGRCRYGGHGRVPGEPVGGANPLRQVIVNTHSPAVASGVPDASLLVAEPQEASLAGQSARTVAFRALSGTWRAPRRQGIAPVTRAELLGPLHLEQRPPAGERHRRAVRQEDPQPLLPYSS